MPESSSFASYLKLATMSQLHPVIIIGAGQAGLATAYHLEQLGFKPLLLEAHARIGDGWRMRWDSLRLFSPAKYSGLPGWEFPLPSIEFPTKEQVADYLENYALRFGLRVRNGAVVESLAQDACGFTIALSGGVNLRAMQVVIATGAFGKPFLPSFIQQPASEIVQMHASQYRNPAQLPGKPVLVIGTGASGSQIAAELAKTHKVYLSGRDVGNLPRKFLGKDIYWWLYASGVMNIRRDSWLGRRMAKGNGGDLLIGNSLKNIVAASGLLRRGKLMGFEGGLPIFEDGQTANDIGCILWATGYRNDYGWISPSVVDAKSWPIHQRGVVAAVPGLYFVGLRFMYRVDSSNIGGMGRDAAYIAQTIAGKMKS